MTGGERRAWDAGNVAGYNHGRDNERAMWRSRLVSDETINEIAGYLSGIGGAHPENYVGAARRMVERILLPVNEPETDT